jgi:hypothetical protein
MLPPPIGFITLYDAVNTVGGVLFGASWQYAIPLHHEADNDRDPHERVITMIAEGCQAGKLAAAYEDLFKGADDLDRGVWQMPHWRNYFVDGMIDVDLPRLVNSEPDPSGKTFRCTRKIFIRRESLAHFIENLEPPAVAASRYPGDAALIEEGRPMVARGMEKRAVARKLAPRAEGTTFESKVDRLRKQL